MAASMSPREGAKAFLAAHGLATAAVTPLAVDASFRRYFKAGDRILMDAPPEHEDVQPFLAVADYLTRHGLRAPAVFAADLAQGFVLLEDLGDQRMREALDAAPDREHGIYAQAVDLLGTLRTLPPADLPPYDLPVLQREADLLTEWFLPALGRSADIDAYRALWGDAFARLGGRPRVTALRDYHAENIMLLPGGALGLLDFQDALIGHPAYDLVSLLQDARREVSSELEAAMLARYRDAHGEGAAFDHAYALLGAQRNAKIVGIFTRLWQRDGKPRYLSYLPRVWGYLERDLRHPALAELREWFDTNVPSAVRRSLRA